MIKEGLVIGPPWIEKILAGEPPLNSRRREDLGNPQQRSGLTDVPFFSAFRPRPEHQNEFTANLPCKGATARGIP